MKKIQNEEIIIYRFASYFLLITYDYDYDMISLHIEILHNRMLANKN
jgi:hypothetical protein